MRNPKSVLITGASSGIGRALALSYARPGVTLALGGRSRDRLDEVARDCAARGATVTATVADVSDAARMREWILAADDAAPLDLVIANAGISLGYAREYDLERHTTDTFAVNFDGVLHTIHPAIERMRVRGAGQIAVMSSLAGFVGLASAPAYSASKVAIRAYGEALRGLLRGDGIAVNVICPGFVETHLTARNRFPMPFLMSADKAARIIVRGLGRNTGRIAFPFPMLALARIIAMVPASWLDAVMRVTPSKR